jgi:hypothetical protein
LTEIPDEKMELEEQDKVNKDLCKTIENDHALKAVSIIFDVIVRKHNIPSCYLEWIKNRLQKRVWQLRVVLFEPLTCKSTIKSNGAIDVEFFNCGFQKGVHQDPNGGFNNKLIGMGRHENLHQVIHCLLRSGIDSSKIEIEEQFGRFKPDILVELDKDKFIAVELGELSDLDKLEIADYKIVKELWFGDTNKLIYSLSRIAPNSEQVTHEESYAFFRHFVNYFKDHCIANEKQSSCLSPYSAFNCVEIIKWAHEFLGIS